MEKSQEIEYLLKMKYIAAITRISDVARYFSHFMNKHFGEKLQMEEILNWCYKNLLYDDLILEDLIELIPIHSFQEIKFKQ